jgi:hypothetical protein
MVVNHHSINDYIGFSMLLFVYYGNFISNATAMV